MDLPLDGLGRRFLLADGSRYAYYELPFLPLKLTRLGTSGPEHLRRNRRSPVHNLVSGPPLSIPKVPYSAHTLSSCFLEAGIFASHIVWRIRTRKIRKAAAAEGKTFDDVLAEHEARGDHFKWADRKWRWGRKGRATGDEEVACSREVREVEEEAGYAPGVEESGYATEDKDVAGSEPDSPVAVGFPPGMAVERTIDGKVRGEVDG